MPVIVAGLVFLTVLVLMVLIYNRLTSTETAIKNRIGRYVEIPKTMESSALTAGGPTQALTGWRAILRKTSKYLEWSKLSRSVEHRLVQAGLPLRGSEFAAICLATTLAGELLFFLLSGGSLMIGMAGGLLGYMVPIFFLRFKIAQRAKAFNNQLGDTLTLVANSLRTGYSFMQAVEMVSREMAPPISVEFARILKEMNLGIPTEEALNNMAKRVDSDDLDLVITAVLIQRQVGGNLAEVLDNIANTIRTRIRLKGELRALTAQGRFSGIIVGLLPFGIGLALYILNPGYMKLLFTHPMGKMMLTGAAGSMVLGILLIRRIVNITL